MAPASIDDNKIRTLMKEHRNNKEKINDAISGWWESTESKVNVEVEEWVTTSKAKKQIPSNANSENLGSADRNSSGGRGAGRGGARAAPAGGRGAGRDTSRGMNPASGRSMPPRIEVEEPIASNVASKAEASASESAAPAVAATSASKGNAWGQKKQAKVESAASESKAAPEPVRALPAPNLPADSLWNSVETAAQRIKRIEREKNQPPPAPPVVEETPAPLSGVEKNLKKKKDRVKKTNKKDKASAHAADGVVTGDETAPLQDASSLLDDLTIDPPAAPVVESPPSPEKVKSSTSGDVEGSPRIGLKMGKWENKSERIDGPSLSFGSFGNATSLVAEETSATSASWGAAASDSSTSDAPVSGGAVWSNGQQNDASNNNGSQNGPPGLGSGKTQRSAPGQSRNKNDNQQNVQQTQAAYQQPPGFGAPGSRGSPVTNMAVPYGQPFEYMHPQFQTAPAPAPVPAVGAAGASTGTSGSGNMLNPAAPQQVQQGYAQPPGMAAPQFYNQNPYYGYQGMQPYYYGQAPVQQNYYGQHQPRAYQNSRGPNHGYADPYNANGYTGGDAFGGQFGNAGQNGNQSSKSGKDASSQDQSTMQQPQQQQQQQQQYPQYMGGVPYQPNPAAGWGAYNQQTAMYGMYPNANPSAPQQGRDNNRGYGNNYNNNNSNSNRSSSNEANAQTGYNSWGGR